MAISGKQISHFWEAAWPLIAVLVLLGIVVVYGMFVILGAISRCRAAATIAQLSRLGNPILLCRYTLERSHARFAVHWFALLIEHVVFCEGEGHGAAMLRLYVCSYGDNGL